MGNLKDYVDQLFVLRKSTNQSVVDAANEAIALISKRIEIKKGKTLENADARLIASIPFDVNAKDPRHKEFWGSPTLFSYEESAHFLGFFGKKNRDKREKFFKGVGKAVTNITKLVAKIATAPATLGLLPFIPAMKSKLTKKGIKPAKGVRKLTEQFYNNIIKHYDYEGYEQNYVEIAGQQNKSDLVPLAAMIPAIISFFKMLFQKKEDGTISDEDASIVAEVENEQNKIDNDAAYKAKLISDNSLENQEKRKTSPIMYIVIVVLAIIILRH